MSSLTMILATSTSETPSSWSDVTSNWSSEAGVQSDGGSYASNGASGGTIIYYDFDIQIPSGSYVTAVKIFLDWRVNGENNDYLKVYFSNDYGSSWSIAHNAYAGGSWEHDYVTNTDLTWDHIKISYAKFKVKLVHQQVGNADTINIDHLEQIVEYVSGAPTPSPEDGARSPTDHTDPNSSPNNNKWIAESSAYSKGGVYATCTTSGFSIYYENFGWSVPSTQDVHDVKVYIHWKTVVDDDIKVKLHWDGGTSSWHEFTAETSWTLDSYSFDSSTDWTAALVNDNTNFKVEIQKETNAADDAVLIDWVGTKVDYCDVRVEDILATSSYKGVNQTFSMKFKNYGTLSSGTNINAKIKIETSDYSDYDTWIDKEFSYTLSSSLDYLEESTYYQRSLPYVFEGYDSPVGGSCDGWFAMNVGDYDITDVYLYASTWNKTTTFTTEGFYVSASSTHEVFCVVLLESTFADDLDNEDLDIYSYFEKCNKFAIVNHTEESNGYNYTQGLYQLINQELNPVLVFDWDPDMFGDMTSYYQDASSEVATLLNLEIHYWPALSSYQNNSLGSPTQGHGFDLLYALMNQEDVGGGVCVNKSIVFQEWFESHGLYSTICAFIHETSHVYGAKDLYDENLYPDISDVIMDGAENWESGHYSSVQIHPITFERITLNLIRFDGPS